jgi:hypothetical protein
MSRARKRSARPARRARRPTRSRRSVGLWACSMTTEMRTWIRTSTRPELRAFRVAAGSERRFSSCGMFQAMHSSFGRLLARSPRDIRPSPRMRRTIRNCRTPSKFNFERDWLDEPAEDEWLAFVELSREPCCWPFALTSDRYYAASLCAGCSELEFCADINCSLRLSLGTLTGDEMFPEQATCLVPFSHGRHQAH